MHIVGAHEKKIKIFFPGFLIYTLYTHTCIIQHVYVHEGRADLYAQAY